VRAPMLISLNARQAGEASLVGLKAAGLNLLLRQGFPVPPGFCLVPGDPLPATLSVINRLPPDLRPLIAAAHKKLGGLVAVRPSPLANGYACATVLGVNGEEPIIRSVARCMGHARADGKTAPAGPGSAGAGETAIFQPVIIQRLADAIASGVAYSANPDTGDDTEIVIHARWGISQNDAVQMMAHDRFRLRKYPLLLLEQQATVKSVEMRAGPVGIVRRPLPQERRQLPSLDAKQVIGLARLIGSLQERVDSPIMVDWVLTKDGFSLVKLDLSTPAGDDIFYDCPETAGGNREILRGFNAIEIPSGVLSPLGWDLISRAGRTLWRTLAVLAGLPSVVNIPPLVLVAGRAYFNQTDIADGITQAMALTPGTLDVFPPFKDGARKPHRGGRLRSLVRLVTHTAVRLPAIMRYKRRLEPASLAGVINEISDACQRLDRVLEQELTPVQLAPALASVDSLLLGRLQILTGLQYGAYKYQRFLRRLRRWCGRDGETMGVKLLAGLGTIGSASPGSELLELARRIREQSGNKTAPSIAGTLANLTDGKTRAEIAAAISAFQTDFGHTCADQMELARPRWGDDPAMVINELGAFWQLAGEDPSGNYPKPQAASRSLAQAWIEGRLTSGWRRLLFWRKHRLHRAHQRFLLTYTVLDQAKQSLVKLIWRYRRLLIRAGQALRASNRLHEVEEVFLFSISEVLKFLEDGQTDEDVRALADRRAALQARYASVSPPPVIRGLYHWPGFTASGGTEARKLKGVGVSPGAARGPARLLRSPADYRLVKPGEVLVAANLDSGASPLFLIAAAAVTELGGRFAEAAFIAREYGLPAVIGADGALASLHEGDLVEVNGDTGVVLVLDRPTV